MDSIQYIHEPIYHNIHAAREVVPHLIDLLSPRSVADIGCGTGSWLRVFQENGISDLLGVDGILVNEDIMEVPVKYILQHNLSDSLHLNRKFDLVICLEVAEHLPKKSADTLVCSLVKLSDIVLFSAAIPGQGGQNHINEQWFSYWQEKFHSYDYYAYDIIRPFFWDNKKVDWWYRQNMFLLIKNGKPHPFSASKKIYNSVHPELYMERLDQIKKIESGKIGFRKALQYLKKAFNYSLAKKINRK